MSGKIKSFKVSFSHALVYLCNGHFLTEGGKYHVIDVLPEAAGKGNAALYLRQSLGLDPSALVVVGDGANDIDMLKVKKSSAGC